MASLPIEPATHHLAIRAWRGYQRLTRLGFPPRFQMVQFPNLPLVIAFVAGTAGRVITGPAHPYATSVGYLAMTVWAYEELVYGSNWFRHLLGLAFLVITVVRVAHALTG
jgi:hypothetical protein